MSFVLGYRSKSKATDLQTGLRNSNLAEGFRDSAIRLQKTIDSKTVKGFMHFSDVIG